LQGVKAAKITASFSVDVAGGPFKPGFGLSGEFQARRGFRRVGSLDDLDERALDFGINLEGLSGLR
jgi:hypothetical protein